MNPCYKCERRAVGCHSLCDDYKEWKDERDERINKINEVREKEKDYNNYKRKVIEKMRKKYGR